MEIVTPSITGKKPTSVFSWLGFGMAAALFLLIWFVNILIFNWTGESANPIAPLYILGILFGGILGILAMVFSIIGLVMATKNNTPKWIGVIGIVLCIASLFSFFVPIMCAGIIKNKTVEVDTPASVSTNDSEIEEDVTIQIFSLGRVRCINNSNKNNSVIGNLNTIDYDFSTQFANWLKMNNVDASTGIIVNSTNDADYSDITKVVEALRTNGITKFRLTSTLSISDYYNL